ncbi:hypothetical protein BGW38_002639 [Lunasporangiospora selenospora]|uniref:S1-like domain-containing protein n=1 Tax=Lunasporangiospora selenospora TaxID=979761 RepID=A0A9P6G0T0_9FUNG|nr:hypothetical protein BGW38_002639 [Lunasporangiospora selenospora]
MSRRRQVSSDLLTDTPELQEGQLFARVLGSRGKNIHEVQFPDGQEILVNLPPKFRNLVWVKRGSYVIVQPAEEEEQKTKVAGDIVAVLFQDHVKQYKQNGIWPFDDTKTSTLGPEDDDISEEEDSDDGDDDLFVNNNRPVIEESDSDSSSEEESDDEEEESAPAAK